jgi:hypothetical protein
MFDSIFKRGPHHEFARICEKNDFSLGPGIETSDCLVHVPVKINCSRS